MPGCYMDKKFTELINKKDVNVILEIGSRDCLDAIKLHNHYKAKVYSFECNPVCIEICKKNLAAENILPSQIELIEKAVYNKNTNVDFYPVVKTAGAKDFKSSDIYKINNEYANIGASSLFKINKDYQQIKYRNVNHHQQGKKISVPAITLDTFMEENNIDKVDLICMDLQGAELMALQGMKQHLKNTKYLITELCTTTVKNDIVVENYDGQGKISDVFNLLESFGFKKVLGKEKKFSHDNFMFINQN